MEVQENETKTKKIIFSVEVDSAINGFAIGISFTAIGIFLLLKPDYFAIHIVSYVIGALIGAFGVVGTGLELSKFSKIKGWDYLAFGMLLLAIWVLAYIKLHSVWLNILTFSFLIAGCYAVCHGLLQTCVSIIRNVKESQQKENISKVEKAGSAITQVVLFLTQLCGLLLAAINVFKAIQ